MGTEPLEPCSKLKNQNQLMKSQNKTKAFFDASFAGLVEMKSKRSNGNDEIKSSTKKSMDLFKIHTLYFMLYNDNMLGHLLQ